MLKNIFLLTLILLTINSYAMTGNQLQITCKQAVESIYKGYTQTTDSDPAK